MFTQMMLWPASAVGAEMSICGCDARLEGVLPLKVRHEGKELIAEAIHANSPRRRKPLRWASPGSGWASPGSGLVFGVQAE